MEKAQPAFAREMYEGIGSIQKWMKDIVKSVQTLDAFVAENAVKMYLI